MLPLGRDLVGEVGGASGVVEPEADDRECYLQLVLLEV
jgi:hypothetical protein